MPTLENLIEVKKITLETSTQNAGQVVWVNMKKTLLGEDVEMFLNFSDEKDKRDQTYEILSKLILDWNLEDGAGNKLPITAKNIRQIPTDDIASLETEINYEDQINNIKKKSLSSTSPSSPATP